MLLVVAGRFLTPAPLWAQPSFSDDSHWDPRFNPPSVFRTVTNVESTKDYLIITGERYQRFGSLPVYGTVFREFASSELHDLTIPGWEGANIIAGDSTIYARRGPTEGDLAILDLSTITASVIPAPPGPLPPISTFGDDLYAFPEGGPYRFNGEEWEILGPSPGLNADYWVVGSTGIFAALGPGRVCGVSNEPDCNTAFWWLEDGERTRIGVAKGTGNPPVSALAVDDEGNLVAGAILLRSTESLCRGWPFGMDPNGRNSAKESAPRWGS